MAVVMAAAVTDNAENLGARMGYIGRGRFDSTKLRYRERAKPSPCVRLQLFAGSSLLVWLAAVEAIRAIL